MYAKAESERMELRQESMREPAARALCSLATSGRKVAVFLWPFSLRNSIRMPCTPIYPIREQRAASALMAAASHEILTTHSHKS